MKLNSEIRIRERESLAGWNPRGGETIVQDSLIDIDEIVSFDSWPDGRDPLFENKPLMMECVMAMVALRNTEQL